MSDWWTDFANNLATDLAPLVSLFGEAPTKQYLSECLYTTDIIIFATAPLGIITAVVSAIRVYGTPSLRAFIGRAQEGAGTAEAELCSSTSRDVCELYNNGGVTRVFGRPKLLEIIHDEEATEDDFYRKAPDTPPNAGIYTFEDYLKTPRNEWRELKKPFEDEERLASLFNSGKAESLDSMASQQNFAPNPNLSLNVGLKKRKMRWYIAASIFGILLQSGVLVWAAIARYYYKFLRDDLQDVYAVPMTVFGTILLCTGIALCACLVEKGTRERVFEREFPSASQIYWVQPGTQFVGDQAFDSFAYTHRKGKLSTYITSWKEKKKDPQKALVWTAISSASAGFVLQFLGLRACHSSVAVAQLGATLVMTAVRSSLRIKRLKQSEVYLADRPEFYEGHELDWLSLNIGDLSRDGRFGWTVSTTRYHHAGELSNERCKVFDENWPSQNGSPVYQPKMVGKAHQVNTNTTFEVLSVQCENNHLLSGFRLVRGDNHKSHANQVSENWPCTPRLGIQPDPPKWPDAALPITERGFQLSAEGVRDHVQFLPEHWRAAFNRRSAEDRLPHEIAKTLLYRARLARLASSWEDRFVSVRSIARSLARAIEDTATVLFTTDVVFEHGWHETFTLLWAVPCSPDRTRPTIEFKLGSSPWDSVMIERRENDRNIYLSLRRKIDVDGNSEGRWRVDEAELEAVLGIWLWSLRQFGINGPLQAPLKRIISAKSNSPQDTNAILDFELWRAGGGFNIIETKEPGSYVNRLFGWQNVSADVLEGGNFTMLELPALTKSFPTMCAQEIYSLFFASMTRIIKSIGGKTTVRDTKRFGLSNTNICRIHDSFVNSGLGPVEDAFACIIPALRIEGKLPSAIGTFTSARQAAELHVHDGKWVEAEKILLWALQRTEQPESSSNEEDDEIKRAELLNHQQLLTLTLCECYRKAAFCDGSLYLAANGIVRFLIDPIFETLKRIPLATEGDCRRTLASTVRCYGHLVVRYLHDLDEKETAKELEAVLQNSEATDLNSPEPVGIDLWKPLQTSLSRIIDSGDLLSTLFFLELFPTSNTKENGSALLSAAKRGWYVIVKNLIDRGAIFERPDKHNRTAISYSAENGDFITFDYLLGKGAIPIVKDNKCRTPLSYAAGFGNVAIVRKLLADARVDPDVKDEEELTPLQWAAINGHEKVVELLLEKEVVNVNSMDRKLRTPLSNAAHRGHEKVVQLLLARNDTDVNLKDECGRTALSWASINGREKAVELFLERERVNLNAEDKYSDTPLSHAVFKGREKVVELLLRNKDVDKTWTSWNGRTLLSTAAGNGHEGVVKLLLATGRFDVDLKDDDGLTALCWAIKKGHERVADLLRTVEGKKNTE
ncbi:ankyrin repeat domain-containing protein 28 [Blastomyces dermatitidis ER-3]|uniref:Ankyrin repeat domain-containing protein 28 n=2 Tax=Blastomyces TaxID=229219 RepID=A0A179V1V8_BLAGS|nr:ankyrin repeat domain-containing protein 28 [Blastomyces gilchristii SLH14081]XP_045273213.1 ankyrin repeat domain-containing protein 28 [Blastomyces dermatitidis ER-3]EEQ85466.1 ankyrin repeat domain-containing protein 28 [Blastomyces dermatitidis ER-3]OAT14315.1 ankyrin repeat domain-containing protein 28 [Blastomyces gilchristii SLH14081]